MPDIKAKNKNTSYLNRYENKPTFVCEDLNIRISIFATNYGFCKVMYNDIVSYMNGEATSILLIIHFLVLELLGLSVEIKA